MNQPARQPLSTDLKIGDRVTWVAGNTIAVDHAKVTGAVLDGIRTEHDARGAKTFRVDGKPGEPIGCGGTLLAFGYQPLGKPVPGSAIVVADGQETGPTVTIHLDPFPKPAPKTLRDLIAALGVACDELAKAEEMTNRAMDALKVAEQALHLKQTKTHNAERAVVAAVVGEGGPFVVQTLRGWLADVAPEAADAETTSNVADAVKLGHHTAKRYAELADGIAVPAERAYREEIDSLRRQIEQAKKAKQEIPIEADPSWVGGVTVVVGPG